MNKRIIGFVGKQGAGKDTCTDYLREKYGATIFKFSTPMKDCLERLNLPATRENLILFSKVTRETFGQDLYAKIMALDATNADDTLITINNIRRSGDISALKNMPEFTLIAIDAPARIRYGRILVRKEKEDENNMTWEQFEAYERAETESTIPEVMAQAVSTIDNSGTLEELRVRLDEIMNY